MVNDLTKEESVGYPHQKRKRPSLSSFQPALQGERCARAGTCCVVEGEPFFKCTGFPFHDFTGSLSHLDQRTGCKGMTSLESKDDVPRYRFWMDLG